MDNKERRPMPQANGGTDMRGREGSFTQMPIRPMTAMPREAKRPPREPRALPPHSMRRQQSAEASQNARPASSSVRPVQNQVPPKGRPAQGRAVSPNGRRPEGAEKARAPRPTVPQRSTQADPRAKLRQIEERSKKAAPVPEKKKRPPKKRPPQKRDWVVPEGSPVYTAEGIMYENRRRRAALEQRRKEEQRRREIEKKRKKEKLLGYVKMFFIRLGVFLVLFSLLLFWRYRSEYWSDTSSRRGNVSFSMADVGSYTAKAATAYRGDILYVDFSRVSQWMGMISVGSISCMRYICPIEDGKTSEGIGTEEYVIFTDGSSTAVINGMTVILEGDCRVVGKHIWVPLSFVENYVNGVEVNTNAKGSSVSFVSTVRDEETGEADNGAVFASFKIKRSAPIHRVEYPE